ncbi:hypothetical protein JOB18_026877 [Solea senegalensis]|uniref:Uncharacterized protein n=1 Tax=Solea senegalensis TaxID=28829 RepID=A0AAV6SFE3_SOLSE|nr:hypothetical protein JOB18_026877 [Solea senegalensis]
MKVNSVLSVRKEQLFVRMSLVFFLEIWAVSQTLQEISVTAPDFEEQKGFLDNLWVTYVTTVHQACSVKRHQLFMMQMQFLPTTEEEAAESISSYT